MTPTPAADRPLVILACSAPKLAHAAPARDLYLGVMWQSLRANQAADRAPHVIVLSALYGFVDGDQVIEPYDLRMTPERAHELQAQRQAVRLPAGVGRILLAGGALYRGVMRAMLDDQAHQLADGVQVAEVAGGIGCQRSQLGRFVRA
jgi:hypothetical protein